MAKEPKLSQNKGFPVTPDFHDMIESLTADAVKGTKARFICIDPGTARATEEQEPLGQQVFAQDPAEFPDPPPNEMVSFWEDLQWQSSIPQGFYGAFEKMLFHCQLPILQDLKQGLKVIVWKTESGNDPESDAVKKWQHERALF